MTRPLKIIHLLPELNSGGVECTVCELANALHQNGHEAIVISGGGRMVQLLEEQGIRHITLPVGKKSLKSFTLVKPMRALFEKEAPDVIHLHSRVPAWIAYLAWKKMNPHTRPKLISTVHGFYSVSFYSAIMTCGDIVTTVSESAKRYVLDNYSRKVEGKEVISIPLGVDEKEYFPSYTPPLEWTEQWYNDFPETHDKWTLCLPGRLTRIKGHEDFIEVIDLLKKEGLPVQGVIVGESRKDKKKYEESLRQTIQDKGLTPDITFTGHRSDLKNILAHCDVTVSLTLVPESFGRTTLESLALGKPTLGYAHGGVEEQLDIFLPEGKVPLGDIKATVDKLKAWYSNPPQMPKEILSPYKEEDFTGAYLSLYEKLRHK